MSKKKSGRGCLPSFIFFLLVLAALFYFRTGGGGGGGDDVVSEPAGESTAARVEKFRASLKRAARKIRAALSPVPQTAPRQTPAPPISPERLAAWSAGQSAPSAADPKPGIRLGDDAPLSDAAPTEAFRGADAGFPGVILLRYNPPNPETGFSAILAPGGQDPISVEGRTTKEFCENLSRRLDELAKSAREKYTRFYALETDNAGPSQTRWLSEIVRKYFPDILCETESSTEEF